MREHSVLLLEVKRGAAHSSVVITFLVLAHVEQPFADEAPFHLGKGRTFSVGTQMRLHVLGVARIFLRQLFQGGSTDLLLCSLQA